MVGGGKFDDIKEIGISRINSSIGKQWGVPSKKNGHIPKNQRLKNKVKQQKDSKSPTFKRKRMWVELTMKVKEP